MPQPSCGPFLMPARKWWLYPNLHLWDIVTLNPNPKPTENILNRHNLVALHNPAENSPNLVHMCNFPRNKLIKHVTPGYLGSLDFSHEEILLRAWATQISPFFLAFTSVCLHWHPHETRTLGFLPDYTLTRSSQGPQSAPQWPEVSLPFSEGVEGTLTASV